ncbi:dienelactone hydrolase family protein [Geodermatophilus sp. YIM 151500]|uniref:dienelactone hydrolase family protein n=1 Tax=Geodermatophilus sp. YIM 151500 TaxID=2984531 RepID=UPI0021E3A0A2|nr:dienelactone hydrolase family protein [Geodermatophilus sp. YIM 151500]MCV2487929.1 dienelactone hydrolase family protein [Geodermatophilus sp. YIM 151500]
MCHDQDSRPPAPPRTGDVVERGTLTLSAADGTNFSAAYAAPAGRPSAGVVILPDVRGLHPYYVALAERFAEAGLAAVALDWFGRTAGTCDATGTRTADFDHGPHVARTTAAGIDADVTACIGYLRQRAGAGLPVVSVGFCFGGSHSWRQSGGDLDLAACVGFYGRPPLVGDAAGRARRPTLMIIAGADAATPVEDSLALAGTMRAAGAEVETAVYEGAPHSFFDRSYADWSDACADAWRRILALTDRVAATG